MANSLGWRDDRQGESRRRVSISQGIAICIVVVASFCNNYRTREETEEKRKRRAHTLSQRVEPVVVVEVVVVECSVGDVVGGCVNKQLNI